MTPFSFNPLILSAFASPGKGQHLPGITKYLQNTYALIVSTLRPKSIHGWFIPSWAKTNSSFCFLMFFLTVMCPSLVLGSLHYLMQALLVLMKTEGLYTLACPSNISFHLFRFQFVVLEHD